MLECGENLHGIARRLGWTGQRLADRIRRHDTNLAARLLASIQPPPPPMPFSEMRRITGRRR